jgi:hypothetical protein
MLSTGMLMGEDDTNSTYTKSVRCISTEAIVYTANASEFIERVKGYTSTKERIAENCRSKKQRELQAIVTNQKFLTNEVV